MNSIISIIQFLAKRGVPATFASVDSANIVYARNAFATMILGRPESHLLFVDDDMVATVETFEKMAALNAPIVGCVYPKRTADGGFVIWNDGETRLQVKNDSHAEVAGIGMGFCLINKTVFEKLQSTVTTSRGNPDREDTLGFFNPIEGRDGILGEDNSFCLRWRRAGGKIIALLNEDIGHIGDFTYRGSYLGYLQSRARSSPQQARPETRSQSAPLSSRPSEP